MSGDELVATFKLNLETRKRQCNIVNASGLEIVKTLVSADIVIAAAKDESSPGSSADRKSPAKDQVFVEGGSAMCSRILRADIQKGGSRSVQVAKLASAKTFCHMKDIKDKLDSFTTTTDVSAALTRLPPLPP